MEEIKVNIIELEPILVASAYDFSTSPEEGALRKLKKWMTSVGLEEDPENHPVYGFDNPPPSKPGGKYGYEYWIKVTPNTEPGGEIRLGFFQGGSYAVARCRGTGNIYKTWLALFGWCKKNKYKTGTHRGLEKHISGNTPEDMVLELYCPVIK